MTRELSCRKKVSKNPEEYQTVSESSCKEPKPTGLQRACFKAACPAEWVPSPWGEVKHCLFDVFSICGSNDLVFGAINDTVT